MNPAENHSTAARVVSYQAGVRACRDAYRRTGTLGAMVALAAEIARLHREGNRWRAEGGAEGQPLEIMTPEEARAAVRGAVRKGTKDDARFLPLKRPRSADRYSDDPAARRAYWLLRGIEWHRGSGSLWSDYPWSALSGRDPLAGGCDTLASSILSVLGTRTAGARWADALGGRS